MASTRDKRLKTDSPTPVANESLITPTSLKSASTAIKLKRMSRNRSGLLSTKSENDEGSETVDTNDNDTQPAAPVITTEPPKTPNTRTKSKAREEEEAESKEDSESNVATDDKDSQKSVDTPRTRKLTKAQLMKKKGAALAKARLLKRNSLPPQPVKSSLRSSLGRRLSGGKSVEIKVEENQSKKSKKPGKAEKKDEEMSQDEETESTAVENDSSIVQEPEVETDPSESAIEVKIKEEKIEKTPSQAAIDLQDVRRSTRQRKSTIKERDNSFTRKSSHSRDKSETKRDSISPALSNVSIKTEKDNSKAITINVEAAEIAEKDPSLSPELISEAIDTESVQQLYDKPDFLENNLGIEQDPKLGEIVKEQEKCKVAEAIIKSDEVELVEGENEEVINGKADIVVETEIKSDEEKSDDEKSEESGEENKENNIETSAKSIGSSSPRNEDRLKSVKDENNAKPANADPVEWKQKESHLFSLGLLTHKAADEAKAAKQKRKEELAKTISHPQTQGRKSKKGGESSDQQYTGTLKIKLKRTEKDKNRREPLKMTFHKKNRDRDANGSSHSESFYTIQDKEASSSSSSSSENHGAISRKSLNRSYNYNHDQVAPSNEQNVSSHEPVINKELEKSLVIPEKASSFKVHPERLCKDQCFYCGGKFGLYDTPCHIAQIKSTERQQKILDSEEKLTKDSCLCDACFRHVDRRANCPSYKDKTTKRLSAPSALHNNGSSSSSHPHGGDRNFAVCNVIGCCEDAIHSIRRKWVVKMRKTITKIFNIDLDSQPDAANVSICERHFSELSHIMICAMCKRKLPRNHIFYINQDITRLENLIAQHGLIIKLSNSTLVVCKLCSYFNNLLFKPPEPKTQKEDFVRNYSKKLVKINNCTENLTLTIRNGKIQPKKLHDISTEVTITPAPSASIVLDNDVCVGYDVPFPLDNSPSPPVHMMRNQNNKGSHKNKSRGHRHDENNEMARALKSNPNISMRELFAGEEEMNLNVNLPFNTSTAQRTADGWFKAQMTVQYDEVTKALWDRLQQPYGNPSSFLRHLILLEKYFRNGDLILSPSASSSATIYSESVRNRLKSYDNIPTNSSVSGATFSNEITITPATKMKRLSDSLTITAQPIKRKNSDSDSSPKPKQMRTEETPKKSSPPELISFNQNHRTIRKATDKNETKVKENEVSITATPNNNKDNVIVLPSTLTSEDRKIYSKSWKPTLLPIGSDTASITGNGPLYQTADGRKLPALVQVMSGGKPYHISIQDYNRLCILRREKLMNQSKQQPTQQNDKSNGNAMNSLPNNNALSIIPMPKEKESFRHQPNSSRSPTHFTKNNKSVPNIPNLILEQNSLIPINSNDSNGKQRHHNGNSISFHPSTMTPDKNTLSLLNNFHIPPALAELSKSVNAVNAHSNPLQIMKAILSGDNDFRHDNIAALAQIASLTNFGGAMLDPSLLSKIPKTLTVIPQAKSDRRASDEQMKQNSASI